MYVAAVTIRTLDLRIFVIFLYGKIQCKIFVAVSAFIFIGRHHDLLSAPSIAAYLYTYIIYQISPLLICHASELP